MPKLLGENVVLGVGLESSRGTGVAPQIFIPARAPSSITPVVEKALIKETRQTRIASQDSELTQTRAEGDIEFNLRYRSIGYLLKSLLGSVASGAVSGQSGAYDHVFSVDNDEPQAPTLTVALAQAARQHYEFAGAVVRSLEINVPLDDVVNCVANLLGPKFAEHADYTVTDDSADKYFRQYDTEVKIATNVAGLGAATALKLKELGLSINNNGRPEQNIGSLPAEDVYSMLFDIEGSFALDYADDTYHDLFATGAYRAMQIKFTRTDTTIGASTNPSMTIVLPKVSFESYNPNRPIDDVVRDELGFRAHWDSAQNKAIEITLRNTLASYVAA